MTIWSVFFPHLSLDTRTLCVRTYLLYYRYSYQHKISNGMLKIQCILIIVLPVSSSASNNTKTASTVDQSVESVKINETNDRLLRDIAHQAAALKAELEISLLKGHCFFTYCAIQLHICKFIYFICLFTSDFIFAFPNFIYYPFSYSFIHHLTIAY